MATATKLVSATDFFDFIQRPENADRLFELDRGEIIEMTRPGKLHGFVCGNLARILGNFAVERKKGYVCTNDTGIVVETDPDTVRGPDLLFFDDADKVDDIDKHFARTPPALSMEVLSPNDRIGKVLRRVQDQLGFGIPLIWLIDPEERIVTVYRPGKEPAIVEEDAEITGEDVLPGLRCQVADFFRLPGK